VVVGTYLYDYLGQRVAADTAEDGLVFFFDQFDLRGAEVVRHLSGEAGALVSSTVDSQANMFAAASSGVSVQLARQAAGATFLLLIGVSLALPGHRRVALLGRVSRRGIALVGVGFLAGQVVPLLALPAEAAIPDPARILFYHVDHLGTVQLVTDGDGEVAERLVNRPYGELDGVFDPVGQPAGTSRAAFQFTGQRAEDGTGLLYFGARYYDPALGMFVSHDPELQFFSPYSYGNGNPLNGTDPTGEQYEDLSESSSYSDPFEYSPYESDPLGPSLLLPALIEVGAFLVPDTAEAPEEAEAQAAEDSEDDELTLRRPGSILGQPEAVIGGVMAGTFIVGGVDVAFDPKDPLGDDSALVVRVGIGAGARGIAGAVSVPLRPPEEFARPALVGVGSIVSLGRFFGGQFETRLGLSSQSVEVVPSAGFVHGGLVCAPCVSIRFTLGDFRSLIGLSQSGTLDPTSRPLLGAFP
jgi:RHS repeat-associated protein